MLKFLLILFMLVMTGLVFGAEVVTTSAIPYKTESNQAANLIYKVIFSFLVISALAYVVAFVIKKYFYGEKFHRKTQSKLNMLELKRISPRLTLFRFEVNGNEICLAQTDKDIIVLDKVKLDSQNENKNPDVTL